MERFGWIIRVLPEKLEEYKRLHQEVWPAVLKTIRNCNIRNYSIFHRDGTLFGYMEYIGDNYKADMDRMALDPVTQEWWQLTAPCQARVETAAPEDWWAPLEEVFHTD